MNNGGTGPLNILVKKSFYSGTYKPENPDKYIGTTPPHYDSSWELEVYRFFDRNRNVIQWGAQMPAIKYFDPVQNKVRRYFLDAYVKYRDREGKIREELVEIKPHKQTKAPKASKGKKKTTLLQEQTTYITNTAKWSAAAKYCRERGWNFRVVTEKHIF